MIPCPLKKSKKNGNFQYEWKFRPLILEIIRGKYSAENRDIGHSTELGDIGAPPKKKLIIVGTVFASTCGVKGFAVIQCRKLFITALIPFIGVRG